MLYDQPISFAIRANVSSLFAMGVRTPFVLAEVCKCHQYQGHTFSVEFVFLCGLVVRVLGYRSGGPGSIPGTTRKKNKSSGSGMGSTQPREYN
jgi:hypothetical protein